MPKWQKEIQESQKVQLKKYQTVTLQKTKRGNPRHKTSTEEREYGTIPGSALATQIALSPSRAQAHPTVE